MLRFNDNYYFLKFVSLFFIIIIFGFWGIDQNSEELYIAFSFFLLVLLGIYATRTAALYYFIKVMNLKYWRLLKDLLILMLVFGFQWHALFRVRQALNFIINLVSLTDVLVNRFTRAWIYHLSNKYKHGAILFQLKLLLSCLVYLEGLARLKKLVAFKENVKISIFSISF